MTIVRYANADRCPMKGDIVRLNKLPNGYIGIVMGYDVDDSGNVALLDRHLDENDWHFAEDLFLIGVVVDAGLSDLSYDSESKSVEHPDLTVCPKCQHKLEENNLGHLYCSNGWCK